MSISNSTRSVRPNLVGSHEKICLNSVIRESNLALVGGEMLGLILSLVRSIRKGGGESSAAATGGGESAAGGGESRADGNGGGGGGKGPEAAGELVRDGRSGWGLGGCSGCVAGVR